MTTDARLPSEVHEDRAEPEASASASSETPGGDLSVEIPDRRYFRIGEVAELVGVRPHVLRYWESEFRELRPPKSRRGQRLYRRRDVQLLVAIRRLLYEERYTIAGARDRLKEILAARQLELWVAPRPNAAMLGTHRLEHLREGIASLIEILDRREADLEAAPASGADDAS